MKINTENKLKQTSLTQWTMEWWNHWWAVTWWWYIVIDVTLFAVFETWCSLAFGYTSHCKVNLTVLMKISTAHATLQKLMHQNGTWNSKQFSIYGNSTRGFKDIFGLLFQAIKAHDSDRKTVRLENSCWRPFASSTIILDYWWPLAMVVHFWHWIIFLHFHRTSFCGVVNGSGVFFTSFLTLSYGRSAQSILLNWV